jgi:hypothetical protein
MQALLWWKFTAYAVNNSQSIRHKDVKTEKMYIEKIALFHLDQRYSFNHIVGNIDISKSIIVIK